ncbi:MAG: DUF2284 domain-containing protein [Firmicutes bacterium]|nr:DUF2284 domain-containing protein [Bacillota bacterium]
MFEEELERRLQEFPLYTYHFFSPEELEFSERVRYVCAHECPQYGQSWACPPAVGQVRECRARCLGYQRCLMISTIVEVTDIADVTETLATRPAHEEITNQVAAQMRELGVKPYVLSTESCAICARCAYLDGQPCRHPERMHPCVESHGINLIPMLDELGLTFQYGENVVTWFSLLFY